MYKSVAAKEFMATNLVTLHPDMDILEAVQLLVDNKISGAPVVDMLGNLVGILSEKDCLKIMLNAGYYEEWGGRVEEFMSHNVETVDIETSMLDVARFFMEKNFRRFPVMKDNELVGQISRSDVLRALQKLS